MPTLDLSCMPCCDQSPTCDTLPLSDLDVVVTNMTGFYNDSANCMNDGWQPAPPPQVLTFDSYGNYSAGAQCCDFIAVSLTCTGSLSDFLLHVEPSDGPFSPTSTTSNSLTFHVVWTTPNVPGCDTTSPSEFDITISW